MGTYSTCETWLKLGFDCILMGFLLESVTTASDFTSGSAQTAATVVGVSGTVTYAATLFLVVQLVFLNELEDSMVAKIGVIILSFVSGGCIIAAIVVKAVNDSSQIKPYPTTLLSLAAAFALSGGVFILLDVLRVKVPASSCCQRKPSAVQDSPPKTDY